jgi:hypothetical protein
MLLLGAGCGENVLVGSLQLRSLSGDAGADVAEAVEADAGPSLKFRKAADARDKAEKKSDEHDNNRADDKSH